MPLARAGHLRHVRARAHPQGRRGLEAQFSFSFFSCRRRPENRNGRDGNYGDSNRVGYVKRVLQVRIPAAVCLQNVRARACVRARVRACVDF